MKKLILPILFILTLTQVKPVWADLGNRLTQETNKLTAIASKAADRQTTALQNVITRANTMVDNRIASLNMLLTRIQQDTRLSADEKATLTGQINTTITNLQSLKTKIDADTDLTTARTDTKSIVTSYHVFVTFEPQIRLLTIVDNLQTTTTTIQNLVPKLSSLSATLKSEGKDTTKIDASIADMNTQLTNITTLLTKDQSTLSSVILTNNTYQALYSQIRQDMAKVRGDFAQIRSDMATIRAQIQSFSPRSTTATGSAK